MQFDNMVQNWKAGAGGQVIFIVVSSGVIVFTSCWMGRGHQKFG